MYLASIRVELAEPLRPEILDSFVDVEMNIENAVAVSLQTQYGEVKIISVSVNYSCEHMGDDVFRMQQPS